MFRIAEVISTKEDKTIKVVCPEIAGRLEFEVVPMRMPGLWKTPNPGDSVIIFGERNNYLYGGRADDTGTYDRLITYAGDGVPDAMVPIWELLKVALVFTFKALDSSEGHVHELSVAKLLISNAGGPCAIVPQVGMGIVAETGAPMGSAAPLNPEFWPTYDTEHDAPLI